MMRLSLFLLGGLLAVAPLPAQTTAADSSEVVEVVRQFHAALATGDSLGALALLADDVVVLEAGGVESRVEYRSHHLAADIEYARAVPSTTGAISVRRDGSTAWVVGTTTTVGTFQGRAVNSTGAELMVLTRTSSGWRIRAIHWSSRRRTTGSG